MTGARSLKTGDLVRVRVRAGYRGRERRTAVVESVSLNGLSFTDTTGAHHFAAGAELGAAR